MNLPQDFIEYTRKLFGPEKWQKFVDSFNEPTPVSLRINPQKPSVIPRFRNSEIPWCRHAYWLTKRPDFTLDPLFHAGCYYVQEAASMFLDEVLRQILPKSLDLEIPNSPQVLDLCAAPGGKSTLLRAALDYSLPFLRGEGLGVRLFSNEPDRKRANILMENLQKQGYPNVVVTNNYAKDYQKAKLQFGLILCDVPCSGEGMFRKDEGAIKEWSLQNVMKCQQLQRSIVEDIWPCLLPGGIMIYSTCTFNTRENEENVRWICDNLGAEVLPVETNPDWNITGSLLKDWNEPVYRFIPGITKTEGLFMCVLRKTNNEVVSGKTNESCLHVLSNGHYPGIQKGKAIIPDHAEALLTTLPKDKYPMQEVDLSTALYYLRRETITLPPGTPQGYVIVTFQGHPLGFVKNLGNRANNLYPPEWRIRKSVNP